MFFLPTWVIFIIDFSRLSNFDYYCLGNEQGSFRTNHQGTVLRNSLTREELGANQKTCKKIHISNYVGIWLRGRWLETGYKGRKKWSKCSFHHLIPWGFISLPGIFHSWERGTGHNLWPQCSKNTRKEKHLSTHLAIWPSEELLCERKERMRQLEGGKNGNTYNLEESGWPGTDFLFQILPSPWRCGISAAPCWTTDSVYDQG